MIDVAVLVIRLFLAAVFGAAGLAKLVDRTGAPRILVDFGVPAALAIPLGLLLPLTELAVAAALLPVATAWWGALGALVLLLLFVAGIGFNLARGRRPDCRCFGQLHSAPVGWRTLARNVVLGAGAAFIVGQGQESVGPSVISWLVELTRTQAVGFIAGAGVLGLLTVEGWLLVHLLRQNGRLLLRIEALETRLSIGSVAPVPGQNGTAAQPALGLPVGAPAPVFSLASLSGETLTLNALRAPGEPVMLIFSDPGCGPCTALMPEIGHWQRDHAGLTIALLSRGTPEANRAKSAVHGLTQILLQDDREVAETYQAYGTPSAVIVRPDGTIGSPVADGAEAIRALVAQVLRRPARIPLPLVAPAHGANGHDRAPAWPKGLAVGETAPALQLPDLVGKTVSLAEFRGSTTAVLFWDPGCGFCQQMLPELKTWEVNRPQGAPKLLVVSTGTVEANQAMGLPSPVVLDHGFTAGHAFGVNGTPVAVLVDPEGQIAAEVAAGAQAVLALLQAGRAQASSARPKANGSE